MLVRVTGAFPSPTCTLRSMVDPPGLGPSELYAQSTGASPPLASCKVPLDRRALYALRYMQGSPEQGPHRPSSLLDTWWFSWRHCPWQTSCALQSSEGIPGSLRPSPLGGLLVALTHPSTATQGILGTLRGPLFVPSAGPPHVPFWGLC